MTNEDALRAKLQEIHRLADAAATFHTLPRELVRTQIRTLAREALALLPAEGRAPTKRRHSWERNGPVGWRCRHCGQDYSRKVGQCEPAVPSPTHAGEQPT